MSVYKMTMVVIRVFGKLSEKLRLVLASINVLVEKKSRFCVRFHGVAAAGARRDLDEECARNMLQERIDLFLPRVKH